MAGRRKRTNIQKPTTGRKPLHIEFEDISRLTPDDIKNLIEELFIQQVELQAQVEELESTQEELQKSRDKYETLYNTIPVGYLTIDKKYLIWEANATAAKFLGTPKPLLLGRNLSRFIAPTKESQGIFHLYIQKIMETGTSQECELEIQRKDGNRFLARLQNVFIDNTYNQDEYLLISIDDITENKKAEEALKMSEERFRLALQNSPVNISSQDLALRYTWQYNPQLGYAIQDVIGKTDLELLPADTACQVISLKKKAIATGKQVREEVSILYNNQTQYYDFTVEPLRNNQGSIIGVMNIVIDITERKQIEQALAKAKDELELRVQERTFELRQSEDKFRRIFETANEAIWIIDLQGKIIMANDQVSKTLGYPLEEIIGRVTNDFLITKQEQLVVGRMRRALSKGTQLSLERRLRHKNGSIIHLLVNSSPLLDYEGQHVANMGMMVDITRRKQAENALIEAKGRLEKANQQLKAYGQRITQVQEEERKRIAYELHDDTAQYLGILKMQLGALADSDKIKSPEITERLQYLVKDADRAFNDVRRYSHELRPVVLEHMGLRAAIEQIADDINKLNYLNVEVDVAGREPELAEQVKLGLFRIAQEALNNIRKHSKAEKAVISLKFQKNYVRVTVIDNGIGFDMAQTQAKAGEKGSLGLLSIRERADLIGASLKIESKPGQGTIVRAEMPLKRLRHDRNPLD